MSTTNISLISNHCIGELGAKTVKLERVSDRRSLQQNELPKFDLPPLQGSYSDTRRHEFEENRRLNALSIPHSGTIVWDQEQCPIDDFSLCSTSPMCPAPICRQFWKAGNYEDRLNSKPSFLKGTSNLRIHPKFLHSNATSHKWVFGAMAELLDNAVDEIQNGATFVNVDKTSNPRDGTPALLIQDDGGGMDPGAMRRCLSFGYSDKLSKTAIGQYGNGFKTSSMRLGADVVVFSCCAKDRKLTQSIGLLSYTFLTQTRQDRIVVPMVDYQFNSETGTWNTLQNEHQLKNNLSILLQWSPFTRESELLKHCDDIGLHGTKIIVYNLWDNDEGKMELDFDSDPEDICISSKGNDTAKVGSRMEVNEQHLANRLHYSLRAYLSVLYLRVPENFSILLRGRVVEYHNIANDLKFPQFIVYKPQNVEGSVITTIGFLKEAPLVNIHGFNVYHKNRLILPFWHVVTYHTNRGRGVVGVLEANFIEPIHNKQDFEKTPVFQKLETRLKDMTQEYWDYHCGLIGYHQVKKTPQVTVTSQMKSHASLDSKQGGVSLKRKGHDNVVESGRMKRTGVIGSRIIDTVHGGGVQPDVTPANQFKNGEAANLIQENKRLRTQCQEYQKTEEGLNCKVKCLRTELQEAQHEYARLLMESKVLEKIKQKNRVTWSNCNPST